MNIFIVDEDPCVAARALCNKHICKMIVESAQLMSAAYPRGSTRYAHTHVNHPCALWARQSLSNFKWLMLHSLEMCEEYTRRYHRTHKTESVIYEMLDALPNIPDVGLTPFARAIKEPWKTQTMNLPIVEAYRQFYIGDKAKFAKWAPHAQPPRWWPYEEN